MKNELALQQPRRTTPEQQDQASGFTHETFTLQQGIPLSLRNMINSPHAALERLVRIASGDSGQSRTAGNFLLAWWNAAEYGGFDLTDLWAVDKAIAEDMIAVLAHLVHCHRYPDSLGYGPQFQIIAQRWR